MLVALLTALGVGGATIVGALCGFCLKRVSQMFQMVTMSAAAGLMLAAATIGLLLPALEGGTWAYLAVLLGAVCGGVCIHLCDRLLQKHCPGGGEQQKLLLFVAAIAVHNLPEGLAAGVGFGTGSTELALTVALGIALQNLPEGMVVVAPLLAAGVSPAKTLLIACGTGVSEICGTLFGYCFVSAAAAFLPFALSFAGGCMVFVIADEMVPMSHREGRHGESYAFLLGFCGMLLLSDLISRN